MSAPGGGRRRALGARWRRRRPLRTRLAVAASAAVALVAICVCTASFFVLRYKLYQQLDQNLAQSATLAAQEHRSGERDHGVLAGECRFLGAPACAQIVPAAAADDPEKPYLLPVNRSTRQVAAGELAGDPVIVGSPRVPRLPGHGPRDLQPGRLAVRGRVPVV